MPKLKDFPLLQYVRGVFLKKGALTLPSLHREKDSDGI